MFDAIAHSLLSLAPELDTAKVEEVPMSLKAWIDASQGNLRNPWAPSAWFVTSSLFSLSASRTVGNV